MGSYTDPQKYYLIDPTELVGVDQDLNYNVQRFDDRLKTLVQRMRTDPDLASVTGSTLPKDNGFKWYKPYTNSCWTWVIDGPSGTGIYQDTNSQVDDWSRNAVTLTNGHVDLNRDNQVRFNNYAGWTDLRGCVARTGGIAFERNINVNFMTLPTEVLPVRSCYFFIAGGATTTLFAARIFVPARTNADLNLEYCCYYPTSPSENYLNLSGIRWPLDDTVPSSLMAMNVGPSGVVIDSGQSNADEEDQ